MRYRKIILGYAYPSEPKHIDRYAFMCKPKISQWHNVPDELTGFRLVRKLNERYKSKRNRV